MFDALSHPYEMFLAQAPSTAIGADPNVNPLAQSQYFNPKAYRVPGNEAENQYGLQPGVDGPFARVDGLKGTHAMLHGALGRMPAGQLSEPLPGTAPPAGTNIPVGPVGNLADPEAARLEIDREEGAEVIERRRHDGGDDDVAVFKPDLAGDEEGDTHENIVRIA